MSDRTEILRKELQDTREALLAVIDGIAEGDWSKPTAVEGWTVRDVVAHLAYNQPSQPRLVRSILEGKGGAAADFDLDYFNRRGLEKQQNKDVERLKSELAAGHAGAQKMLDEIDDSQLDRMGNHPSVGHTSVEQIFRTIALHDAQHTEHIRAALSK